MSFIFPYDVYVLASARNAEVVEHFRRDWVTTSFTPAADDYELPRWADNPSAVFDRPEALIDALLICPDEPHEIYWRNTVDGSVRTAMLFFTTDQQMIVGLTVDGGESPALDALRRLADTVGGRFGYLTSEEPPPDTAAELVERATSARPALVDGAIRS